MRDNNEKTSLILHGHFYQPPRENPFTGIIPKQVSASPWEDWNERIFSECYGANCHSRYLNSEGRVRKLTNNYSYISFNFGPTLLHWLDTYHPDTIELLKEADQASIKRLGHGNAMAQAFNHTILPLDKERDARLQIEWGYKDFEHHFGRTPEGMWLPECGVNDNVVQYLYETGIKFIVLSPWQCKAVENENGILTDLEGKPAPYSEPYILTGSNGGEIQAFFYHPGLAEGISFGHMLRNADALYEKLKEIKDNDRKSLIHTATDGEIYGHHEPYGDMALAALIEKVEKRDDFFFDNYGSYAAKHPAVKHAELHRGEAGKGTSWSCSHGVSRWYKDCGCHTGGQEGWNQAWRTPLRNGLNNLAQKLDAIFDSEIRKIFAGKLSSNKILSLAGDVFTGKSSMTEFIRNLHADYEFSTDSDITLSHLLSGMKNRHFSFTSCGFFFSDISGIEPRQDIKYALFAIQMFQPFCEEDLLLPFLADLRSAKSNIKGEGDGMSIAQEEMKGLSGQVEATLYFYLNRTLASGENYRAHYGNFMIEKYGEHNSNPLISIQDKNSQESFSFIILPASTIDNGVNLYICEVDSSFRPLNRYRIKNTDIPERIVDETLKWIDHSMTKIRFNEVVTLSEHMRHFSTLVKNSKYTNMDTQLLENMGLTLKLIKSLFIGHPDLGSAERIETIGNMFEFIKKYGRDSEIKAVRKILSDYSNLLAESLKDSGLDKGICKEITDFLSLSRAHGFEPVTKTLQDYAYPYYAGNKESNTDPAERRELFLALNFE